jgi:hypothetical protein
MAFGEPVLAADWEAVMQDRVAVPTNGYVTRVG